MSFEKSWPQIAAGAAVGSLLAYGLVALVAAWSDPRAKIAASSPMENPSPAAPSPPAVLPSQNDATQAVAPKPPRHEVTPTERVAPATSVELKDFKHVLLQNSGYMKVPENPSALFRDFAWQAQGELPNGELVRVEQRLPNALCLIQRTGGERVLIQDVAKTMRPCWQLEVSAEAKEIAQSRNDFGWDLYQLFREQPGNLFFSPSSIAEALAMVGGGARQETAAEISKALHMDVASAKAHAGSADLRKLLLQPDRHRGFELLIANRAWAQQGFTIEAPYTATLRENYGTDIGLVDYQTNREAARNEINAWISEQTKGHLRDVLAPGDLQSLTRLVLTNAIYFQAEWDVPFEKSSTRDEPFFLAPMKTKAVHMMRRHAQLRYSHEDGLQAVAIPYGKGQLAMILLVPEELDGLASIEAGLSSESVDRWISQMTPQSLDLFLPRLEMKSRIDLQTALQKLGMVRSFDLMQADFSGMHIPGTPAPEERLLIDKAIHEAVVKVDEEGTVAAAATIFAMAGGVAPTPPPQVRADRPFVFLIRDELTGTVLFVGRVMEP